MWAYVYILTRSFTHTLLHKTISTLVMWNALWYLKHFFSVKNSRTGGTIWKQNARPRPLLSMRFHRVPTRPLASVQPTLQAFLAPAPALFHGTPRPSRKAGISYAGKAPCVWAEAEQLPHCHRLGSCGCFCPKPWVLQLANTFSPHLCPRDHVRGRHRAGTKHVFLMSKKTSSFRAHLLLLYKRRPSYGRWPGSPIHSTFEELFPGKGRWLFKEGITDSWTPNKQKAWLSLSPNICHVHSLGPFPLLLQSKLVASPLTVGDFTLVS